MELHPAQSFRGLALVVALSAAASPLAAGVQVAVKADGTKIIFNESTDQRARRHSTVLASSPSLDWDAMIEQHANSSRLDPKLVRAVIQTESGYNASALSTVGAMGLMQLMPGTARELAVEDPYDPSQNIRGGTAYLRQMLDQFKGSLELAVAAYNAGPGAVQKYGGVPPYRETVSYVQRVLGLYRGEAVTVAAATRPRLGQKVFLLRDARNQIVLSTAPAGR